MPENYLESEFTDIYDKWKSDPTQDNNAEILNTLSPVISGATRMHVGSDNPLLRSQARRMTLRALKTYDPSRSRLKTHLTNHLRGLKRVSRKQSTVLAVPERVALDKYNLDLSNQELADELGREPSVSELADKTGLSSRRIAHVRCYMPAVAEGTMQRQDDFLGAVRPAVSSSNTWQEIVYEEAAPLDKKIMEWTLGLGGQAVLPNAEIARRLKRSPGAISQRKQKLQELLDQEETLSPFV